MSDSTEDIENKSDSLTGKSSVSTKLLMFLSGVAFIALILFLFTGSIYIFTLGVLGVVFSVMWGCAVFIWNIPLKFSCITSSFCNKTSVISAIIADVVIVLLSGFSLIGYSAGISTITISSILSKLPLNNVLGFIWENHVLFIWGGIIVLGILSFFSLCVVHHSIIRTQFHDASVDTGNILNDIDSGKYIPHIHIRLERLIYYIILCGITTFLLLASDLNPFSQVSPGTDESVWLYFAHGMHNGMIPYVDMFDHKGLLLYFIYYVGVLISNGGFWGVWLIILLLLFVSIVFGYKTAYLITKSEKISFLSILLLITTIGYFGFMAGIKEVFTLPFIIISLYLVTRYIINKKISWWELLIIGCCCSCVLMITPTLATFWVVAIPYIIIREFIGCKSLKSILLPTLYTIIGIVLILIPHLCYLYATGSFDAFVECYIQYNLNYSNAKFVDDGYIKNRFYLFRSIITNGVFIFAEIIMFMSLFLKDKMIRETIIFSIFYYIITLIITCGIGGGYNHYMIVCIPCLILPLALGITYLYIFFKKHISPSKELVMILLLICVCLLGFGGIDTGIHHVYTTNVHHGISENDEIIQSIIDNTNDSDMIQVLANHDHFYLATNRDAASRFEFIPHPHTKYDGAILLDIENHRPKIIITGLSLAGFIPELQEYVAEHYTLLKSYNSYNLYILEECS